MIVTSLNNNKIFWGLSIFLVNTGSRFVIEDILSRDLYAQLVKSDIFKIIVVFCMFFVGTKDVMVSLCLTICLVTLVQTVLNTSSSKYNIHPLRAQPTNFYGIAPSLSTINKNQLERTNVTIDEDAPVSLPLYQDALNIVNMYNKQHALINPYIFGST